MALVCGKIWGARGIFPDLSVLKVGGAGCGGLSTSPDAKRQLLFFFSNDPTELVVFVTWKAARVMALLCCRKTCYKI